MLPSTRKCKGSRKYKKVRGHLQIKRWGRGGQLPAIRGLCLQKLISSAPRKIVAKYKETASKSSQNYKKVRVLGISGSRDRAVVVN